MGGKSKQTQRTKNNARPSSSGRSAELLGANIPPFVGFSAHSGLGILPVAPGFLFEPLPDSFDASIDPQFQVVLRKMSKKDPVTKTKALQEFVDLIKASDINAVKAILPLWPNFYHNVANDIEHRVREAAQQAHMVVVEAAGKNIAPQLKQLVPVWMASQFDNYAPAGHLAAQSLKSAFPANKQKEVFGFCQNEIMDFLIRNIVIHTAATLCNSKIHSENEVQNKYHRILSSNLRGYALFLANTPFMKIEEIISKHEELLNSPKFWNLAKHEEPGVRAAWHECIASFLQFAPQLLETHKQQVVTLVFLNMADTDPSVLPHVWSCILLCQQVIADWHTHLSFKKVVFPKLFSLLKNGGSGNASTLCPHYLPFISKLSEDNVQGYSLDDFYSDFFRTLKTWLISLQANVTSKSEISANVTAFYECLKYVVQRKALDKGNVEKATSYALQLLNEYLNEVITWCTYNENTLSSYLYGPIANLIIFWSQNELAPQVYATLTKAFWDNLKSIVQSFKNRNGIDAEVGRLLELSNSLFISTPKASANKVTFMLGNEAVDKRKSIESQKNAVLHSELRSICVELAKILIQKSIEENTNKYVSHLKSVCDLFDEAMFYKNISENGNLVCTLKMLKSRLEASDPVEVTVDMIFNIVQHLPQNERLENLKQLLLVNNCAVQLWTLQRLLSYPLCIQSDTRNLLAEKFVSDLILGIAKDVIKENSKEKLNVLHKCFFQTESGEILVDNVTVSGIIDIMSTPLVDETEIEMMDTCASFIAQIMPVICSENTTVEHQREVFLKLFKFSITTATSDNLSEDTLWEVTTCWQDALSSEDIKLDMDLMSKCSDLIHKRLSGGNVSVVDVMHIAKMAANLFICSNETVKSSNDRQEKTNGFLKLIFQNSLEPIVKNLDNFCCYVECLNDLCTPEIVTNEVLSPPDSIKSIFATYFFHICTLCQLMCDVKAKTEVEKDPEQGDDDDYIDNDSEGNGKIIEDWSDDIYELVLNAMDVTAMGISLSERTDLLEENVAEIILNMKESVDLLLADCSEDKRNILKRKLVQQICTDRKSWARSIPFFLLSSEDPTDVLNLYENLVERLPEINSRSHLSILQIIIQRLPARSFTSKSIFLNEEKDLLIRIVSTRLLIKHYFSADSNELNDAEIIRNSLNLLSMIANKEHFSSADLLYNRNVADVPYAKIIIVIEVIKLLAEMLTYFPKELSIIQWDFVRIALSAWVLTASSSIKDFKTRQVAIFIASIYKLHTALFRFFVEEKTRSSTVMLTNLIDEWENCFALETSLVLFKTFYHILSSADNAVIEDNVFYDAVGKHMDYLDYSLIFNALTSGFQISMDECVSFLMARLSQKQHSVRIAALGILRKFTNFFVKMDLEKLEKRLDIVEKSDDDWHVLCKSLPFILKYKDQVDSYIKDFSYKLNEISDLSVVDRESMLGYLLIWDFVIMLCSKAPAELRSSYAHWITTNQLEQTLLQFLFRSMPVEILRNYDSKLVNNDMFKSLDREQINDKDLLFERYACHMYAQMLRHLPAIVRKWWNEANTRQKTFVDKLTTNYVSSLICQEELRSITSKKEKHENMQITVHTSTREVIASYCIDEAKMELVIALAPNHPLGSAKIESEKQIGGRLQSRVVVRQLTIFLTHQNGSIFDVLSLWKKNLDKKFEGVEECYVCYSVIHQDTCQLPKLSCKTCRKKFHGPCLYKWFTTSSKSTCPICRNVF